MAHDCESIPPFVIQPAVCNLDAAALSRVALPDMSGCSLQAAAYNPQPATSCIQGATPRPAARSLKPAACTSTNTHFHTEFMLQFNTQPPKVAPGGELEPKEYLRMGWLLWPNKQPWEQVAKDAGFDP